MAKANVGPAHLRPQDRCFRVGSPTLSSGNTRGEGISRAGTGGVTRCEMISSDRTWTLGLIQATVSEFVYAQHPGPFFFLTGGVGIFSQNPSRFFCFWGVEDLTSRHPRPRGKTEWYHPSFMVIIPFFAFSQRVGSLLSAPCAVHACFISPVEVSHVTLKKGVREYEPRPSSAADAELLYRALGHGTVDSTTAVHSTICLFPLVVDFSCISRRNRQACTATSINPADLTRTGRVTD